HHSFLLRFLELSFELSDTLVLALNLLLSALLGIEARTLTSLFLALQLFVLSFLLLALALERRDLVRVVGTVVLFEPLLSLTLQPGLERFPLQPGAIGSHRRGRAIDSLARRGVSTFGFFLFRFRSLGRHFL